MRQWLAANGPVDGEDLERHDKWLCMMWPRLHLLRELLADSMGAYEHSSHGCWSGGRIKALRTWSSVHPGMSTSSSFSTLPG